MSESIIDYCKANPYLGPSVYFCNGKFVGHITEQISSICDSDTYEGVISQLNDWCRSELTKLQK